MHTKLNKALIQPRKTAFSFEIGFDLFEFDNLTKKEYYGQFQHIFEIKTNNLIE